MAYKKNYKRASSSGKKYSYNERKSYHSSRLKKFVDKFRTKTGPHSSSIDFDKYERELKKINLCNIPRGFLLI